METLGQRIKNGRKAKGWTQAELGEYAGIGKSAVCQWEKDRIRNPAAANLHPIAMALGLNTEFILTGKGEKYLNILRDSVEYTKLSQPVSQPSFDPMNPNTIENLFNLKCKTKAWIIFLLGNSDNESMGVNEYLALTKAYDMLGDLIESKRHNLKIDKEKV